MGDHSKKPGCGSTTGKSMTQQHQANDVNINTIVARARKGTPLPVSRLQPLYGDFSKIGDYRECCERLADAQDAFMTLTADVRLKFGNDPGAIIEFLKDEKNRDEAIALGLIEKPAEEAKPVPKTEEKPPEKQPEKTAEGQSTLPTT